MEENEEIEENAEMEESAKMEGNAEMYRCHISNYSFLQPSHISEMSSPFTPHINIFYSRKVFQNGLHLEGW